MQGLPKTHSTVKSKDNYHTPVHCARKAETENRQLTFFFSLVHSPLLLPQFNQPAVVIVTSALQCSETVQYLYLTKSVLPQCIGKLRCRLHCNVDILTFRLRLDNDFAFSLEFHRVVEFDFYFSLSCRQF